MSEELFTTKLREFTNRRPFIPFVVELVDGGKITVEKAEVAINEGCAGFISETEGLVSFAADEVRGFAHVRLEAAP
jgi:hypothetical protein